LRLLKQVQWSNGNDMLYQIFKTLIDFRGFCSRSVYI
jgi:hypothetical protein